MSWTCGRKLDFFFRKGRKGTSRLFIIFYLVGFVLLIRCVYSYLTPFLVQFFHVLLFHRVDTIVVEVSDGGALLLWMYLSPVKVALRDPSRAVASALRWARLVVKPIPGPGRNPTQFNRQSYGELV